MDFIGFSGELVIYCVLIALGGGAGVAVVDVARRELTGVVPLGDQQTGDFHGFLIP